MREYSEMLFPRWSIAAVLKSYVEDVEVAQELRSSANSSLKFKPVKKQATKKNPEV